MKNMKILAVLLAVLLIPAAALAQDKGAVTFSDEASGLSFSYPASWVELTGEDIGEEELAAMVETLGIDESMLDTVLNSVVTYIFDFDAASEDFVPNLNVVVTELEGFSSEYLLDEAFIQQMSLVVDAQMAQAGGEIEWITPLEPMTIGEHDVLMSAFTLSMSGLEVSECQIILAQPDMMYVFTYTTHPDGLDEATLDALEAIIESVTFA